MTDKGAVARIAATRNPANRTQNIPHLITGEVFFTGRFVAGSDYHVLGAGGVLGEPVTEPCSDEIFIRFSLGLIRGRNPVQSM